MKLTLMIWRQPDASTEGAFHAHAAGNITEDMSFLEMLDVLNERLNAQGEDPIAFDSDCREGICGACGLMINGVPHGPKAMTATCQLHMRSSRTVTPSRSSRHGPTRSSSSRTFASTAVRSRSGAMLIGFVVVNPRLLCGADDTVAPATDAVSDREGLTRALHAGSPSITRISRGVHLARPSPAVRIDTVLDSAEIEPFLPGDDVHRTGGERESDS